MAQLSEAHQRNLETLIRAGNAGRLAVLDCQDRQTGKPVAVIVALNRDSNGDVVFVPMARMFDTNPYDELNPPDPEGGYDDGLPGDD